MQAIYDRIIEYTKTHGISGKELAKILDLKKSPLTDWKNQKSKPTLEQIIRICENFAISSDYLLFGKNISLPQTEAKLIEYFHNMTLTDQEDLLLIAEMKYNKKISQKMHNYPFPKIVIIHPKQLNFLFCLFWVIYKSNKSSFCDFA